MNDLQLGTRRRRFLRIGLRSSLVLLTVGCVWLGFKVNKARQQREAVAAIREAAGSAWYDYEWDSNEAPPIEGAIPLGPDWLRSQVGVDYLSDVVAVDLVVSPIPDLSPLSKVLR